MTDRDGTAHLYKYDDQGNEIADIVTALGAGNVSAVPLPPAAWTGIMRLSGMGVLMLRSRMRM